MRVTRSRELVTKGYALSTVARVAQITRQGDLPQAEAPGRRRSVAR